MTPDPLSPPGGDAKPSSSAALLAEVYDELRAIAEGYLLRERAGHTLQPTALVHEAFLRLAGQDASKWNDGAHFAALAATIMRRVLVDHARRRATSKRGGGERERVTLTDVALDAEEEGGELDLLGLDEALNELASLHPRQARVVELRFFGGRSLDAVAEDLGVARSTIALDWRMARAWLDHRLSGGAS